MKIAAAEIFYMHLPFKVSFTHAGKSRRYSDSIIVKLTDGEGSRGFGECVARPYVTGETAPGCLDYMQKVLWPSVSRTRYEEIPVAADPVQSLQPIADSLPERSAPGVIAWNGARAAFETALIDLLLKRQELSLGALLKPRRDHVIYSGVVGLGSLFKSVAMAGYFRCLGLTQFKLKIGNRSPLSRRLRAVRSTIGRGSSLRLDANGAFTPPEAERKLAGIGRYDVTCIEQPVCRTDPGVLTRLQQVISVPLMADESLVTLDDARRLINAGACGYFNLRLAKCGGVVNTLKMSRLAYAAGIRVQLGCQVGETAILSALGRHVAAHLEQVEFVEGSYGSRLLKEDLSTQPVGFDTGGRARVLTRPGLGIEINEGVLHKYSRRTFSLEGG